MGTLKPLATAKLIGSEGAVEVRRTWPLETDEIAAEIERLKQQCVKVILDVQDNKRRSICRRL